MDRRVMIKQSTYALAGIVSLPSLSVLLQSCNVKNTDDFKPIYLSEEEYQTVWAMAEVILPATDTPSANEAGVAPYIDLLFGEYLNKSASEQHKKELNNLMKRCQQTYNSSFSDLNEEDQKRFLDELDSGEDDFFSYIKNLMVWAYFTSEQGMNSMDYSPVPAQYQGCYTSGDSLKNLVGNSLWWQMLGRYEEFAK